MFCITPETLQTLEAVMLCFYLWLGRKKQTVMIVSVHFYYYTYVSLMVMVVSFSNNCIHF